MRIPWCVAEEPERQNRQMWPELAGCGQATPRGDLSGWGWVSPKVKGKKTYRSCGHGELNRLCNLVKERKEGINSNRFPHRFRQPLIRQIEATSH
ncbi:hypothetical protein CEXT_454251 [Caerostris extrusa]|uniref:Uncharacterized protein n=1 Tax=Caerostris extrusa TaxID=172846 RepID=A0AAV4SCL3_CAEEX|nr:hypothetical protein CEXT_454251 [Caerostris extrusa]